MPPGVVIVGASIGGVKTARALRAEGFDGSISLLDAQPHAPYDKPPLTKGLLSGSSSIEDISLLSVRETRELDLDLQLDTAALRVHPADGRVATSRGEHIVYGDLVLATGSTARIPAALDVPGIHVVRGLDDCLSLRADLVGASSILIVGAGFVGAEVASSLAGSVDIHLIDPKLRPMARFGGDDVGAWFAELQIRHGINTHFGVGVERLSRSASGEYSATLTDGDTLVVDLVLVATGGVPNDDLAVTSGLPVADGVLCDPFLQVEGFPAIHAIGDVARWTDRFGASRRSQHWTSAVEQATFVARKIVHGHPADPFETDGYVWSDQHGLKIQMIGQPIQPHFSRTVVGMRDDRLALLYGDERELRGALVVNWPKALIDLRRGLRADAPFSLQVAAERLGA